MNGVQFIAWFITLHGFDQKWGIAKPAMLRGKVVNNIWEYNLILNTPIGQKDQKDPRMFRNDILE